jgi:hypothetical protein
MTLVLESCFTQTDPLPYGAGSLYEQAFVYATNCPSIYRGCSIR